MSEVVLRQWFCVNDHQVLQTLTKPETETTPPEKCPTCGAAVEERS